MDAFEIPAGTCEVRDDGTIYCKPRLKSGDDVTLALTMLNDYQRENGWPKEGCVNVNSARASETTAKNWVGYVQARFATKLLPLVVEHGAVRVHARIEHGGSKPSVTLLLPDEYA